MARAAPQEGGMEDEDAIIIIDSEPEPGLDGLLGRLTEGPIDDSVPLYPHVDDIDQEAAKAILEHGLKAVLDGLRIIDRAECPWLFGEGPEPESWEPRREGGS